MAAFWDGENQRRSSPLLGCGISVARLLSGIEPALGIWTAAIVLIGIHWMGGLLSAETPFQNPVKQALKQGRPVIGATITAASPDIAATLASSGFDFLWIEMEHSPLTLETVRSMILATRGMRAMPFTRVPVNEPWMAKRVLDAGSMGVVFPFSSTRELAEQAVKSCRYPPLGIRGFGPSLAAPRWDFVGQSYPEFANENVMVIPIIEQKQAVDNIDAIASVPGIDVLFIGASDLSFSLGVGGQRQHPLVLEAIAKVLAAGKKYNIPVGYPSGNPEEIKQLTAQGFLFFQATTDLGLMKSAATDLLNAVRGKTTAPSKPPGAIYGDK